MYHKVNDVAGNPVTVPSTRVRRADGAARRARLHAVSLDDVLAHYVDGGRCPQRAVLITFDDGYRDNLDNAVPVLQRHGYPAVLFAPIGYLGATRAAAARRAPRRARDRQPRRSTGSELAELEAGGRPRRVARHRPQAARRPRGGRGGTRDHALEAPARGGARTAGPRLRLREGLGGALPAGAPEPASQAGYDVAFTSISGANGPHTDPLQLHRYNVEPYPPRTFELVLAGACDLIALKDTVAGTHARRWFNAALGTSTK